MNGISGLGLARIVGHLPAFLEDHFRSSNENEDFQVKPA
jgi:hypothetical protein